jgi:hypothetical protein
MGGISAHNKIAMSFVATASSRSSIGTLGSGTNIYVVVSLGQLFAH